jgi:hypothetical protein
MCRFDPRARPLIMDVPDFRVRGFSPDFRGCMEEYRTIPNIIEFAFDL